MFGGSNKQEQASSFYSLDLKTYRWELVRAKGNHSLDSKHVPESRDEHTAILNNDEMVIFGGFVNGERTNEIFKYSIRDNKWTKIERQSDDVPCPRAGHSAVLRYLDNDKRSMVIFGGKDEDNEKLKDVWEFNFETETWQELIGDDDKGILERSGHSACMYKGMMLVFGGIYEITKELNDLLLFDFRNNSWISLMEQEYSPTKA